MGVGDRDDFEEKVLANKAVRDEFVLFWEAMAEPAMEAFSYF